VSKRGSSLTEQPAELATGEQAAPQAAPQAAEATAEVGGAADSVMAAPGSTVLAAPQDAGATAEVETAAEPAAELAIQPPAPARPASRHPNLGLAPLDMSAGYPQAAAKVRAATTLLATRSLEAVAAADPTLTARYSEVELRRLLRDGELLTERLAMCLGSANTRWLTQYAEWIAPIYRRRGVSLLDLASLCDALGTVTAAVLAPDELDSATASLAAAAVILRRNSSSAGDRHRRNALWKWMYKGI